MDNKMNYNIYNLMLNYTTNPIFQKLSAINLFPNPYMKYKIIPCLDEKKALDVTSVNDQKRGLKKNNLIIWEYHGGPNQMFYVKADVDGQCVIVNNAKGFAVKVPDSLPNEDTPMVVGPMQGAPNEKWLLK
jgi:hypothetical protein